MIYWIIQGHIFAMQPLELFYQSIKNKTMTQEHRQELCRLSKTNRIHTLLLWELSSGYSAVLKLARVQAYLLLFIGLVALPITVYEKYQQDNRKAKRLAIATPIAVTLCCLPMILYKKYTRNLMKSIEYCLKEGQFKLTEYAGHKQYIPKQLSYSETRNGRVKAIEAILPSSKPVLYQIEGLGDWDSIQVFKEVVSNPLMAEM